MATFGKTAAGGTSSASSTDKKTASKHTPATSGTVTSITFRASLSAAGSSSVRGFIYADSAGAPGALLAIADVVTVTATVATSYTGNFTGVNQISITSGTPYWIGYHWSDPGVPSLNVWRETTASGRVEGTEAYADGTSDPFGAPTTLTGIIDCFVTYTEGGTPPAATNNFFSFF